MSVVRPRFRQFFEKADAGVFTATSATWATPRQLWAEAPVSACPNAGDYAECSAAAMRMAAEKDAEFRRLNPEIAKIHDRMFWDD